MNLPVGMIDRLIWLTVNRTWEAQERAIHNAAAQLIV